MRKKFKIKVEFINDVYLIDCDYLGVYGEAVTFKKALKSFIADLKQCKERLFLKIYK